MTQRPIQGAAPIFAAPETQAFRLEVYLESPSPVQMEAVAAAGVHQVELAGKGATTPSIAMLEEARRLMPDTFIQPIVNSNPRGFVYTPDEIHQQANYIRHTRTQGADGFVVGCLKEGAKVDPYALESLVQAAGAAPVTFHSAFDEIAPSQRIEAIAALASAGVKTIMTAGGKDGRLATHSDALLETQRVAQRFGLAVMARGGIELVHLQDLAMLQKLAPMSGVHARFNASGEKSFNADVYWAATQSVKAAGLCVPPHLRATPQRQIFVATPTL